MYYVYLKRILLRVNETAQHLKVPAPNPSDLSIILGTHMVEGEHLPHDLYRHTMAHACVYTPPPK